MAAKIRAAGLGVALSRAQEGVEQVGLMTAAEPSRDHSRQMPEGPSALAHNFLCILSSSIPPKFSTGRNGRHFLLRMLRSVN